MPPREKDPLPEDFDSEPSPQESQTTVTAPCPQGAPRSWLPKEKSLVDCYVLSVVPILGLFGSHHFYLGRTWFGLAYFLTVGLFGVGYVIDIFRTPYLVAQYNKRLRKGKSPITDKRCVGDTYVLWFPCGLFGMHHFYLRNYKMGLLYFFTFGILGIGWIVDLFRIPKLVKQSNENYKNRGPPTKRKVWVAYVLSFPPLGLLGVHQFYMRRPIWGIIYAHTAGIFGLGMIFDWFRMKVLVDRANKECQGTTHDNGINEQRDGQPQQRSRDIRHIDDVFVLWLPPLGFFGAHHFYLRRFTWGFLYLFTCGGLGVGWLIDACRLHQLTKTFNKTSEERRKILNQHIQNAYVVPVQQNGGTSVSIMSPPDIVPSYVTSNYPTPNYPTPMSYDNPNFPPPYQAAVYPGAFSGPTAPPAYTVTDNSGHPQAGLYPHLSPGNSSTGDIQNHKS